MVSVGGWWPWVGARPRGRQETRSREFRHTDAAQERLGSSLLVLAGFLVEEDAEVLAEGHEGRELEA